MCGNTPCAASAHRHGAALKAQGANHGQLAPCGGSHNMPCLALLLPLMQRFAPVSQLCQQVLKPTISAAAACPPPTARSAERHASTVTLGHSLRAATWERGSSQEAATVSHRPRRMICPSTACDACTTVDQAWRLHTTWYVCPLTARPAFIPLVPVLERTLTQGMVCSAQGHCYCPTFCLHICAVFQH